VCGWVLGVNKTAYLVLSLLALVGAYVAGREHNGGWEAAARGAVAGLFHSHGRVTRAVKNGRRRAQPSGRPFAKAAMAETS